jgi:hypothetical protein
MIKHIVLFRFTEIQSDEEKRENAKLLSSIFTPLKDLPSVKEYNVGVNISNSDFAWDVVIDSSFDSLNLLKEYSISKEHQEAIRKGKQFAKEKSVIDYEY